jgi:protein-S-isoprenylcysteine O-methyltransferase Ste14
VVKVSEKRHGLGSEHPLCDRIQLIMLVLFLVVWGIDSLSFFIFGYSTVLVDVISFPALLLPSFASLGFGLYLVAKSHKAVFGEAHVQPKLLDSGVYSWVRHPMYLGILMCCLAFFFTSPSLLSLGISVVFFMFYNKMTTYEEKSLIQILGEEYLAYQKRVPKWFPKLFSRSQK